MIWRPKGIMMRGRIGVLSAVSIVLLSAQVGATGALLSQTASSAEQPRYAANQVLITLRAGRTQADLAAFNAEYGGRIVRRLSAGNIYLVELPANPQRPETWFAGNSFGISRVFTGIQDIQLNRAYRVLAAPTTDPYYRAFYDTDSKLYGQWPYQPDPATPSIQHIHAPEAWDLEKGSSDVLVAVIDTGIRLTSVADVNDPNTIVRRPHPDLVNRLILDPAYVTVNVDGQVYAIPPDTGMMDFDPSPPETGIADGIASHGTNCAGIIAAQGDNGIGITGLCWNGVRILAVKACNDGDGMFYDDALYEALEYVIRYRDNGLTSTGEKLRVNVVNMSLGGSGALSGLLLSQFKRATASGIIIVAAAGNDWESGAYPPGYPAALDEVICVGSTNYRDEISSYSQRGRTLDIVAPGEDICSTAWSLALSSGEVDDGSGDGDGDGTEPPITPPGSLSSGIGVQAVIDPAFPDSAGNYIAEFISGTSFSAPVVTGAVALLMSHGVPASDVKEILYSTATPIGFGRPNDTYGWGMLNIRKALEKASCDVQIRTPAKSSVVTSSRPSIRVDFRRALKSSIEVRLDQGTTGEILIIGGAGARIADWEALYYTLDAAAGKTYLQFDYPMSPGVHTLTVTAQSDENTSTLVTATDTSRFTVRADTLASGWHMFSVPYKLDPSVAPEALIGTASNLWRYSYPDGLTGSYSAYSTSGRADAEATFQPPSVIGLSSVHPQTTAVATPPAGLGYWLRVRTSGQALNSLDTDVATEVGGAPYHIGLYNGWNMVGCPFVTGASWASAMFDFGGLRYTAFEAVQLGLVSNYIYSYDPQRQGYSTAPISTAVMQPWKSQWVRVKVDAPESSQIFNSSFLGGFIAASSPNCTGYAAENWSPFSSSGNAYFGVGSPGVLDTSSQKIMGYGVNSGYFSAGIYQQVAVSPGSRYSFSVWTKRQRDCTGVIGTCRWPVGEGTQVGIDPTGGIDPMSSSVVWSPTVEGLVGDWSQQTAYALAEASQITVFIKVVANAPGTDRYVLIDNAKVSNGHDVTLIVNPG